MKPAVKWGALIAGAVVLPAAGTWLLYALADRGAGGFAGPPPAGSAAARTHPAAKTIPPPAPDPTSIRQVRKGLPPVTRISVVGARDAGEFVRDDEFVVGVEAGGEARAYPLNMLANPRREILNDTLGGVPIGVTWCNECRSPAVFARELEGQTLTLSVSGGLAEMNMVIKDVETGTEWIQLLGEAVRGPLKGKHLELLPGIWTDWKTWRTTYPDTTVAALHRMVQDYRHAPEYGDAAPERAFFNELQWGLARDGRARSWPLAQLAEAPVVNDAFGEQKLLVFFDRHASTVTAFEREVDGKILTFRAEGTVLKDEQATSTWDRMTGRALSGPLAGRQLKAIPGVVCLVKTWAAFHPDSEIWGPR